MNGGGVSHCVSTNDALWAGTSRLHYIYLNKNTGNDANVDERPFCQLQDRDTAEWGLKQHWDTFITEDYFKQMAGKSISIHTV